MKSILLPLVVFIMSTLSVNAQDVGEILTSGKWYVSTTQENGSEPEEAEDKNDEWIIFLPDGKTEEEHFGDNAHSKWKYLAGEKAIKLKGNNEKIFKVIELSGDKMVVEVVESGEDSVIVTYVK